MPSTSVSKNSNGVGLTRGRLYRLAVMALGSLVSCAALAVIISPVKVELSQAHSVVTITVTNDADAPLTLQHQVLAWTQVNGEDVLEASNDLLVAPAIAQIAPRGTQVFRVTQRHPSAAAAERAYRLVLDDISATKQQNEVNGVNFVFSHRLPVFVAGTGTIDPQLQLAACEDTAEFACVRLQNAGDRYVQIQSLTVYGKNWQTDLAANTRILAGAWKQWLFVLPASFTGSLHLNAETSVGPMTFELTHSSLTSTGSVSRDAH